VICQTKSVINDLIKRVVIGSRHIISSILFGLWTIFVHIYLGN